MASASWAMESRWHGWTAMDTRQLFLPILIRSQPTNGSHRSSMSTTSSRTGSPTQPSRFLLIPTANRFDIRPFYHRSFASLHRPPAVSASSTSWATRSPFSMRRRAVMRAQTRQASSSRPPLRAIRALIEIIQASSCAIQSHRRVIIRCAHPQTRSVPMEPSARSLAKHSSPSSKSRTIPNHPRTPCSTIYSCRTCSFSICNRAIASSSLR